MNMHITTQTRGSLAEHAVIANFSLRQWEARKYDKRASLKSARDNNANPDSVRLNKRLIAKAALAKLQSIVSAARKEHESLTLPWGIRGMNILAMPGFFAYRERMAKHQAAFESAASELCDNYEALRDEAKLPEPYGLGDLFNESDYPNPDQIRHRFSFSIEFLPVPGRNDFRVNLPDRDLDAMREGIENRIRDKTNEALRNIFERALKPLQTMADSLAAYEPGLPGVRAKHAFHGTLVSNLAKMAETLPLLNIFGDSEIAKLAERMAKIASIDTETLKDSDAIRADTERQAREAVADITSKMADYF